MYHQFNIQQILRSAHTMNVYVLCQSEKNSDYFHIQHSLTGFYNRVLTISYPVVTICSTGLTFKILRSAHTEKLCVLYGSENKQQIFPYNTLTDWFV
jgi:hypothetical protein